MRALGFEAKKSDVLQILKDYDRQNTGRIGFTDFSDISKLSEVLALIVKPMNVVVTSLSDRKSVV